MSPPPVSSSSNVVCSPWQDMALGSGTGSATYDECTPDTVSISTNAVTGLGATADNQHIVYHELCGNGEIIVKVAGITNSGYAGLFVRESNAVGARKGAIMTQKGSQVFRQIRLTTDGVTAQASYIASGHQWLKLTRSGTQVIGSWSTNGTSWNVAFNTALSMTDCVVMGMFAYSGNSSTTVTATFTNISIVQSDTIPASEVAFADSSLTAHPGDTVEICLNLQNPCYCSPLSVDVALTSDSLPHLVGFEPQTLTFEEGDTVQCFSLVLGSADTSGTYTFELTNVEGGYEGEVGAQGTLALVVEQEETQGETTGYCGSVVKDSVAMTPGENYFFDRFGNVYTLEELLLPQPTTSSLSTGCGCDEFTEQDIPGITSSYFNLVFEDCEYSLNGGFNHATDGAARRKVACKVFAELSQLITAGVDPCSEGSSKVNIRFVKHTDDVIVGYQNTTIIASGTPFFDYLAHYGGIIDGLPWRVINNGRYTHLEDTDMFHGEIRVDFTKSFFLGDDSTVPSNQYDLYSVLLHESLHVLGFLSLINPLYGNPLSPATISYSRYDLFLKKELTGTKIIDQDITDPYKWNLNIPANELHSTCQSMASGDMIFAPPMAVGNNLRVFTGSAGDPYNSLLGSSFSHIYASCTPSAIGSYLMNPTIYQGIRKEIGDEEKVILCSIGYEVVGMANCPCVAVGDNDVRNGCDGTTFEIDLCDPMPYIDINPASLLANDQEGQSIGYLTSVTPNASTIDPLPNGDIRITPCAPGTHLFKYIPMKEGCEDGGTVLIVITATRCLDQCVFFSTEEPINAGYNNNPCNMICNPEVFIQGTLPEGFVQSIESNIDGFCYDLPGWFAATGTPDYVRQTQILAIVNGTLQLTDTPVTVFPYSGSIQMQSQDNAESVFTSLFAGQGSYFLSYYAAAKVRPPSPLELNFKMQPRLVDQSIIDQFIRNNTSPDDVNEVDLNTGESLELADNEFSISSSSLTFHRRISCFEIEPGKSYNGLWFYPATYSSSVRVFSYIDQVELLPDNFTAGEDRTIYDCETIALGGVDFCMLSEVPVRYSWKDEGDNELLSYEVIRDNDGTFSVDGQANGSIPYLVVSPDQTTTYTLVREVVGNAFPDFATCFAAEDEVVVEVQTAPPPTAVYEIRDVDNCGHFHYRINDLSLGATVLWDFGDGMPASSSDLEGDVFFDTPGSHSFTLTVTNTCDDSEVYEDAVNVAIDQPDAGFSTLAFCLHVAFTPDQVEGEHDWDFGGDGALTGTDATPAFEYEESGTYNVTHTFTNACGLVAEETIAVTVEDCAFSDLACECADPYILDVEALDPLQTDMKLSYFTTGINYLPDDIISNACIIIRGRLIVDVDYEINESEVLMEEGAEIVVAPQVKFTLSGMNATQKVHGCDHMWKGITVQTDGHFIAKQAWIEDAQYAVHPLDKSRVDITFSTFVDNYVGLYFEGPYGFILDPFAGNTFTTDDDLLPAFADQTPNPGLRSFAGIEVLDRYDVLHIGVAGYPVNTFEDLRNGIITKNTPLFVERSRFLNITATSSEPTYPFTGFGIRHEGGAAHPITVVGLGSGGQTAFEDCTDAVWVQGTNAKVTQSRLVDVTRGIQVRLATEREIELNYNYISCSLRGILLLQNDPADLISLHHNTIHAGNASPLSKAIGIMVSEQGTAHENPARIGPRNIVETNGNDIGIYLGSANHYWVFDNEITLHHSTSSLYGIYARDALNSLIEVNTIEGTATDSGTGIEVFSSTGMEYSCNILHNLQTGMHLNGTCTDTEIRGNTFDPPFVDGLHYGSMLDINAQIHRGNIWNDGTYSGAGARNDIEDDPNVPISIFTRLSIQRFEIHDDESEYYPPSFAFPNLPTPIGSYIGAWFPIDPTGDPWGCNDQLTGDEMEKIRDFDKLILSDTAFTGDYAEARLWSARQQLYRKVALQGGETDTLAVDSFYLSQGDSLLGLLYAIEAGKKALFEQSLTEQQEVTSLNHECDSLIQLLAITDSLLMAEEDVWDVRDTLIEQIGNRFLVIDSLDSFIKAAIYQMVEALAEYNGELESGKGFAYNEMEVNAIYLATLASDIDTFSTVQLSVLAGIAAQCPFSGGRSVFKAQHLLHLPYPDSLIVDLDCQQALFGSAPAEAASALKEQITEEGQEAFIEWKAYPNPTRNVLQVEIANIVPVTITLLDMYGRVLLVQEAKEAPTRQTLTFDTSGLNSGLYLMELSGLNTTRQMMRVVIMK